MLVENPARVKQCVRIALQVQLNHYKQLEASEGVFITKPGWHTDRNDELVYYVGPIRYAVHAAIAAANASGWQTTTELINDEDEAYCDSCYERGYGGTIHNYSYKPEPIFYGDGPLYLGVELEVDEAGKDNINAVQALRAFNQENVYGYVKSDGSLNDGFELVTHPCTLETHLQQVPWRETLEALRGMGYRSHAPGTCGLHVHVSRKALGKDVYEQEETIAKLLYIFERFWQEILRFSRRTESQINHWAARYGYKDRGEEILKEAKHGANGRYACINLTNTDTIEFRVFRGTLKYNTVIATLQFVANLCRVAISLPEYRIQEFSWPALIEALTQDNCPELVQYLKERNLYVNEPVTAEREV